MQESPSFAGVNAKIGLVYCCCDAAYLTTDWKSGEVSKLANWLSLEE